LYRKRGAVAVRRVALALKTDVLQRCKIVEQTRRGIERVDIPIRTLDVDYCGLTTVDWRHISERSGVEVGYALPLGFVIDVLRECQSRFGDRDGSLIELAEEAASIALVTGCTRLFDCQQNGIGIAIDVDTDHALTMTAFFTFPPELTSASTVVGGPARLACFRKGLRGHPGHH
jgi:hypothetical protein